MRNNPYIEAIMEINDRPIRRTDSRDMYEIAASLEPMTKKDYDKLYKKGNLFGMRKPEIVKVIFSKPATIVFWNDATKTVVKCENEDFDPEKGLAMAITKKMLGDNKGNYYNIFKKWIPEGEGNE